MEMTNNIVVMKTSDSVPYSAQLYDLPWEDLVFSHILPKLNLADLCRLRQTCKTMQKCITGYFSVMKHLELTYTGPRFTARHLQRITEDSRNIQSLDLSAAKRWLDNKDVLAIVCNNQCLESINLHGCSFLKVGLLQEVGISCRGLRRADLGDCHWVTTADLLQLAAECPQLNHIDLAGCWNLSDDTFLELMQLCKILKHINISDIYSITDNTISTIAHSCPELNILKIKACWRVTDDSVRMLGELCRRLKVLHVKDCRSVTDASLARLRLRGIHIDVPMRGFVPSNQFAQLNEAQSRLVFRHDLLKLQI